MNRKIENKVQKLGKNTIRESPENQAGRLLIPIQTRGVHEII